MWCQQIGESEDRKASVLLLERNLAKFFPIYSAKSGCDIL